MGRKWIREESPQWDADKARIIGKAPAGIFQLPAYGPGDRLPGEWWRVEEDGKVVGYGWMDFAWGDAEMLVAIDPAHHNQGLGTYVLDQLEQEAAAQGVNYLHNVVRVTHPDREAVTAWLESRHFSGSSDGVLRRRVRAAAPR